ncbi:MAG: glycyl-radical enzyme activating protein [Ruminococcaceae bacterium]|nr:glycyl-radical enzyme activating protein [Oscillospiraceae bacterium]MBR2879678.1 glycyl-radical enzyme activating protein [Oscillospiraceae bacterium]
MKSVCSSVSASVFNIQSYSIHDGPGIRVTVFVKGCPLRCQWCANPESNLTKPQLMTYAGKCTGCGECVSFCPHNAISMLEKDGKMLAYTDRTVCVDCGMCVDACPAQARELVGKEMTVEEVIKTVLRDKMFMDASGGGVTISGGEPLMHPEFTETLLRAAKEEGLHTAIESCSFASREVVDKVFRYVDLGLLDIKHMDSAEHRRLTGVPNEQILDNIKHIHNDLGIPIMISLPTIPGCNDSEENIAATAKFVAEELIGEVKIRLLPYHRLGESKNENLGNDTKLNIEVPSDEHMEHLKAVAESFGVQVQIGG